MNGTEVFLVGCAVAGGLSCEMNLDCDMTNTRRIGIKGYVYTNA